jgi:response regulator RpfG family c-di-GMP phosphodiesterase
MSNSILFVDDEKNVLDAYRREFETDYSVTCAAGGPEGLAAIKNEGPFAVIVSDMQMDGMNGIEFLKLAREAAPDSVRLMITGANVSTAVEAVNEGRIFRFLTKPCDPDTLRQAVEAAFEQYRLVAAERNVLSTTLTGAVKILVETLSAVRPVAFGRAIRVKALVRAPAEELIPDRMWQVEVAALLSQVGCVFIGENTLRKAYAGRELNAEEWKSYSEYPKRGGDLVANVPRLNQVAVIIANQERGYDGSGFPDAGKSGEDLPMESRILKVALDYDALVVSGRRPVEALTTLCARTGQYDRKVLDSLRKTLAQEAARSLMAATQV